MEKKPGIFSKNLLSLKLQLNSLLEDVGGNDILSLLDSLAALTPSERAVAIRLMSSVSKRLCTLENRSFTKSEEKMRDLEDTLVNEIVRELEANPQRLSLVHGGKFPPTSKNSSDSAEDHHKAKSNIIEFKPILN